MPNRTEQVGQALAMFDYQLKEERDKGLADGARLFISRFLDTHGVTPGAAAQVFDRLPSVDLRSEE